MSQPIRGQVGDLVFQMGPKNTNMVEDVKILLPVKFRWMPYSCFRGEVENDSSNQRSERPSCFSDRPQKHKRGRGRWILLLVKFHWIPFSGFREVENVFHSAVSESRKYLTQSEARAAIFFADRHQIHKLGRGRWDLVSSQVSLNSVQWFQRRSRKCLVFWSAPKHKLDRGRWDLASCQVALRSLRIEGEITLLCSTDPETVRCKLLGLMIHKLIYRHCQKTRLNKQREVNDFTSSEAPYL